MSIYHLPVPEPDRRYVVVVSGCRDWTATEPIARELKRLNAQHPGMVVVVGGATGADEIAIHVCREEGIHCVIVPAAWSAYGKGAGPIRNALMLELFPVDEVLAFHPYLPNSKGTKDMVERAREAGIAVSVYGRER